MNTETQITEYTLSQECESLAKSIIDEYDGDATDFDALREYAYAALYTGLQEALSEQIEALEEAHENSEEE